MLLNRLQPPLPDPLPILNSLSYSRFFPCFVISEAEVKVRVKKVKMPLCLTKHHAMKSYWGVEIQFHAFLISALDGGE
jgi:hypothetical protein